MRARDAASSDGSICATADRTSGSGSAAAVESVASSVGTGSAASSSIAEARTMPGCGASATMAVRTGAAATRPARAAAKVGPPSGRVRHVGGRQRSSAAAAHAGVLPRWQDVHVSGAPVCAARSGRGTLNPWSCRRSTPM